MSVKHLAQVGISVATSTAAGWRGTAVSKFKVTQPEKLLELYEYENSPYCRRVREVLTDLDLDVIIRPCPQGGQRFRDQAVALSGKSQFPFLVDPNTGTTLLESADIIEYLYKTYASSLVPAAAKPSRGKVWGSYLASVSRGMRGWKAQPSKAPEKPLELFSFESSPYSRLVRERLSELELPYILRNFGKYQMSDMGPSWVRTHFYPDSKPKGRNRLVLLKAGGKMQVPYLIDPNTGAALYESAEILAYLNRTYAV